MAQPGDLRPLASGDMSLALPDTNRQLNLYQFAGNSAWLQMNDKGNWLKITLGNKSSRGDLRRFWDAYGVYDNAVTFSGQKHVADNQTFFGYVRYHMDYKERVNRAIDIEPYDFDPFVLSDSTEGDFFYSGPQVFVVFSHRPFQKLWWGVSLDYQIYRGLKKIYSMPEIVRRKIALDLSLAWAVGKSLTLGISMRPYDINDLTDLVLQPDGVNPVVLRYRGEFYFHSATSKDDRTAISRGAEVIPQLMYRNRRLEGILTAGYYYRWYEVYDNETQRNYDGYYQGERYYFNTAWRYYFSDLRQTGLSLGYRFGYMADWAEEPVKRYVIYRSYRHQHRLTAGFFKKFNRWKAALETDYDYLLPDKRDYLAHSFRRESLTTLNVRAGALWDVSQSIQLQGGVIFSKYREGAVWNYFGDFNAMLGTVGISYAFKNYILEFYSKLGRMSGLNNSRQKDILELIVQINQFL